MRFRPVLQELPFGTTDRPASYPDDLPLDEFGFTPVDQIEEDSIVIVPADPDLGIPARYVLGPTGMTGEGLADAAGVFNGCLLYTSPSPRDRTRSRMPSSA